LSDSIKIVAISVYNKFIITLSQSLTITPKISFTSTVFFVTLELCAVH